MVLDNTPYGLVMKNITDEADKVLFFQKKELRKAHKTFVYDAYYRKWVYWTYYTIPSSMNKYLVWFLKDDSGALDVESGSLLVVTSSNGDRTFYSRRLFTRLTQNDLKEETYKLCVYTSHFFRRFRERMGFSNKLKTEEIIVRFFLYNSGTVGEIPLEKMNKHFENYKNGVSCELTDGIAFITRTTESLPGDGHPFECIKFNTFLPHNSLKAEQREATTNAVVRPHIEKTLKKRMFLAIQGFNPAVTAKKKEVPSDGTIPTIQEVMMVNNYMLENGCYITDIVKKNNK